MLVLAYAAVKGLGNIRKQSFPLEGKRNVEVYFFFLGGLHFHSAVA